MENGKKKRKVWWILGILGGYMLAVAFFAIKIGLGQMNAKVDLVAVGQGQEAVKIIPEISFWDAAGAPFGWLFGDVIGGGLAWFFGDLLGLGELSLAYFLMGGAIIALVIWVWRLKKKSSQPTL